MSEMQTRSPSYSRCQCGPASLLGLRRPHAQGGFQTSELSQKFVFSGRPFCAHPTLSHTRGDPCLYVQRSRVFPTVCLIHMSWVLPRVPPCTPGSLDLPLLWWWSCSVTFPPHCQTPSFWKQGPCLFPFTSVTFCRTPHVGDEGWLAIGWVILSYGNIGKLPEK